MMIASNRAARRHEEKSRITAEMITPHFQPIADLRSGDVIAYEILSRGPVGMRAPAVLFDEAERSGTDWELERACRTAALRRIAALRSRHDETRFFLNISPRVIRDPRFVSGFTLAALHEYGVDQRRIVLEITERESVADYGRFEQVIQHYRGQGFDIALDDFGSGHSGLLTLISCAPQYIKLDMAITRAIDEAPYKQHILDAVVALSRSVDAQLIAEGIETTAELRQLIAQGVRYGQGWLLGRAETEPRTVSTRARELMRGMELVRTACAM